jgi:uncharacterized membrane protein YadS
VIAIVLGILLQGRCGPAVLTAPGLRFSGRSLLQTAIVISGLGVSFNAVLRTGIATLPVTLITVTVALALTPLVGRLLHLERPLSTLIGVGTAICGASAIAAVSTVLESTQAETALAIATIFFYNRGGAGLSAARAPHADDAKYVRHLGGDRDQRHVFGRRSRVRVRS